MSLLLCPSKGRAFWLKTCRAFRIALKGWMHDPPATACVQWRKRQALRRLPPRRLSRLDASSLAAGFDVDLQRRDPVLLVGVVVEVGPARGAGVVAGDAAH